MCLSNHLYYSNCPHPIEIKQSLTPHIMDNFDWSNLSAAQVIEMVDFKTKLLNVAYLISKLTYLVPWTQRGYDCE